MSQTHLHFVETRANEQRQQLCHVVEFFYGKEKKVQVLADSTMAAQHLDQLLWTFSQESFIPHRIIAPDISLPVREPVVIAVGERVQEGYEILVCDGSTNLSFVKHYPHVIHFVLMDDPGRRQESRLLWQAAKNQGFEVQHISYSPPLRILSSLEESLRRSART